MDSDSESQDSDEGRRFRFEATRKDEPVAPVDRSRDRTKSPKKKSKHKSSRCDDSSRHYRERKERSKHESGRKTDDKDLRHLIKHTKHESWSGSRQEDKNSHKDHRDARDASAGANDRGSRHATSGDARERSRDSKRQSDRDWSGVHRGQRSREHSHERNYDELRGDRHRSRCRERHKHRSRDRSRERSHQSTKIKSSSGDRSREDHGKPDSARKSSVKENRSQNSRGDYSSPKSSTECSHSESRSSTLAHLGPSEDDVKKESSLDLAQDCKELDLSQFDVLSETDENTSDGPDSRGRTLSLRHRETKLLPPTSRGRDFSSRDQSESREPPEKRARTEQRQERRKVNMKNDDDDGDEDNDDHVPAPGASNNPSAVSDSSLVPSATVSEKTRDARVDSAREKPERREQESTTLAQNSGDAARPVSRRPGTVSDEARSPERVVEQSGPVYGPLPMTELTSTFDDAELEASPSSHDSSHCETRRKVIDNNDDDGVDNGEKTRARLIGPCLPPIDETKSGIELRANVREATAEVDVPDEADMAFGPALPPHLIQRMRDNESQDKFIGPVMPDAVKKVPSCETLPMESDDDYAIGPLPADHPALRNNRVYEQLEMRAHRIRHEGTEEVKRHT